MARRKGEKELNANNSNASGDFVRGKFDDVDSGNVDISGGPGGDGVGQPSDRRSDAHRRRYRRADNCDTNNKNNSSSKLRARSHSRRISRKRDRSLRGRGSGRRDERFVQACHTFRADICSPIFDISRDHRYLSLPVTV